MADDWEEDDWDAAATNFKAQANIAPAKAAEFDTKGQAILAGVAEPDMSKFADEDDEAEEKVHDVVKPQPKKKEEKKYTKATLPDDTPLDDPELEKQRRQRLVEQADYAAAKELFGDIGGVNLDTFLPKSVKDFDDYASTLAMRYIVAHKDNKNFKAFLKSLVKYACEPLPSTEIKDVETSLAGLRSDKHKAEQAALAAKTTKKKQLNTGKGTSAGLDDYIYEDAGAGDDYDFM